jgi:endonuclease-3
LAVEKQLVNYLPKDKIHIAHHWLILHGRYTCLARSPKCQICPLIDICKYYQQSQTETALQKAEKTELKKLKDLKKKRLLDKQAKALKKLKVVK